MRILTISPKQLTDELINQGVAGGLFHRKDVKISDLCIHFKPLIQEYFIRIEALKDRALDSGYLSKTEQNKLQAMITYLDEHGYWQKYCNLKNEAPVSVPAIRSSLKLDTDGLFMINATPCDTSYRELKERLENAICLFAPSLPEEEEDVELNKYESIIELAARQETSPLKLFLKLFGATTDVDDPLFLPLRGRGDYHVLPKDLVQSVEQEAARASSHKGVDPAYVYAYKKLGFYPSQKQSLTSRQWEMWNAAVEGFRLLC